MEQISIDTAPATAVPDGRWAPYRPHATFVANSSSFASASGGNDLYVVTVDDVLTYIPWHSFGGDGPVFVNNSTSDINTFYEVDNLIGGASISGVILKYLGVYWVNGTARWSQRVGNHPDNLTTLLIGPGLEDSGSVSAGGLTDNVHSYLPLLTKITTVEFQGFAVVTDLEADNHLYLGVMQRGGVANGLCFPWMQVTYMGQLDTRNTT